MAWLLIALPLAAAAVAFFVDSPSVRARLLPATGILHLLLLLWVLRRWQSLPAGAWLGLDALGGWVLLVISVLFCICAFYAPSYLALRPERDHRIFSVSLLSFLGLASLLAEARHPGVAWVAMETTTLATAPLVYFNRNRRSLEATWKYLVIGSVGIALALLGTLFIAYAAHMGGVEEPLQYTRLMAEAGRLSRPWLRAGFVLTLVGYGTKMGLAPLHTWKPDAYGETPGIVGALLAGGVTSCAFLALHPHLRRHGGGGRGPLRPGDPGGLRPALHGLGPGLHGGPAGLQAAAGLLQRGAHGHPRPRHRASGAPPPGSPCSTWPPTPW